MLHANRIFFLLVFALFWGGLTFYTGFVVRISHDVLDDAMLGGLITQRVTGILQILGVLSVALMGLNAYLVTRSSTKLGYVLTALAIVVGLSILGLFVVHGQLDAVIDVANTQIIDYDSFEVGHRRYNQLTTVEWLASLMYLLVTVVAWRVVDRKSIEQATSVA